MLEKVLENIWDKVNELKILSLELDEELRDLQLEIDKYLEKVNE